MRSTQQMVLNWVKFKSNCTKKAWEVLAYFESQLIVNLGNQAVKATNTILSFFNRRIVHQTREMIIPLDLTVNRTQGTDHCTWIQCPA